MTPAAALARSLPRHPIRHVLALAPVVLGDELADELRRTVGRASAVQGGGGGREACVTPGEP